MNNHKLTVSEYILDEDIVPVPKELKEKDARADAAAKVSVLSASGIMDETKGLDLNSLNIVVLNRDGCAAHIEKVSNGVQKKTPRQGFFARGGPQTLASYTALAFRCHGAAFTLVGDQNSLQTAIGIAIHLIESNANSCGTLLTVVVKKRPKGYNAKSILIEPMAGATEDKVPTTENTIYKELISLYS